MTDLVRVIPFCEVGCDCCLGFPGVAEVSFGFPELVEPAIIILEIYAGIRLMSHEIRADGGNIAHRVAAAVVIDVPIADQLFLDSGELIHDFANPIGRGIAVVFFAFSCVRVPFDASRQQKFWVINTEVWVTHEDYLGMFVREAGIQVLQDFFGVYSESSALNEYLGCINALSAAFRALCGAHKAVDCDISESVLVIASHAEHDQVAIGGKFVYLF